MFEMKQLLESALVPYDDRIPQYVIHPIEENGAILDLVLVNAVGGLQFYLPLLGDDIAIQKQVVSASPVYPDLGMERNVLGRMSKLSVLFSPR